MGDKIREYVDDLRSHGYSDGSIRNSLERKGYGAREIDGVLGTQGGQVKTGALPVVALIMALVIPIVGLVLGIVCLVTIDKRDRTGRGLATASVIISGIFVLISLVALLGLSYFATTSSKVLEEEVGEVSPYVDEERYYVAPDDESDCLNQTDIMRGLCFKELGILTSDPEQCAKAAYYESECLKGIDRKSGLSKDEMSSVCKSIEAEYQRASCFRDIAVHKHDVALCRFATGSEGWCLEDVDSGRDIPVEKLAEVCDYLEEEWNRGYCYFKAATYRHDAWFCDRAGPYEEQCLQETG